MDVDNSMKMADASNKIIAPSHRVPSEVVAEIIRGLLPAKIDYDPQMQERLDALLTATGICRYWRHAALDHATLWSVVPMDHKSLGELFLQRSRNAPLLVTYGMKTRNRCPAHQAMASLLPYMHRVESVHLRAPVVVVNEVFSAFNQSMRGAQLKEVSVQTCGKEEGGFDINLLLKHASTLKVLRAGILGSHFPGHKLQEFSGLTHLEVLTDHDIRDVLSVLTSLPTLTSTKVHVNAMRRHRDEYRIVLPANLCHIHLQISNNTIKRVLDALRIPTGVHFVCEILPTGRLTINEPARHLTFPSGFFENTSHIEELQLNKISCSGFGPSGSFAIEWASMGIFRPPIENLSLLRKLVVDGAVGRWLLGDIVGSAPSLVSVVLIDCRVIAPQAVDSAFEVRHTPDTFVKAISKEHSAGTHPKNFVVNGTLEGESLEEFRSLLGNHRT